MKTKTIAKNKERRRYVRKHLVIFKHIFIEWQKGYFKIEFNLWRET